MSVKWYPCVPRDRAVRPEALRFIGLDSAVGHAGIGVIDFHSDDWRAWCGVVSPPGASKGFNRRVCQAQRVIDCIVALGPTLVTVEGYALRGKFGTDQKLAEVCGAVKFELARRMVPFIVVPPASVKYVCGGNGRAKKEAMFEAVRCLFPHEAKPPNIGFDQADAMHLASFGAAWAVPMRMENPGWMIQRRSRMSVKGWKPDDESSIIDRSKLTAA